MKIKMYGTRGSIPTPSDSEIKTSEFGGNTTCVYLEGDDGSRHIIDAGTGIRKLGQNLLKDGFNGCNGSSANLYITHTHWDHIQGLPFFAPAFIKRNNITVYGEAKVDFVEHKAKSHDRKNLKINNDLERVVANHSEFPNQDATLLMCINGHGVKEVLKDQQEFRNFPVPIDALVAMDYIDFMPGTGPIYEAGRLKVETKRVAHPGGCISYKFTETKEDGRKAVFVFNSDYEPTEDDMPGLVGWWKDADLVIADGQYEPADVKDSANPFMQGWGHSDFKTNLRIAGEAGVKHLMQSHHEPKMDDDYHKKLEKEIAAFTANSYPSIKSNCLCREGDIYRI